MGPAGGALNNFVVTMNHLYLAQLSQTQLIVYLCVGVICFLVLLQIPFIYSIHNIIMSQAQLFLRMPTSECRSQQKMVDSFIEQLKVTIITIIKIGCRL